MRNAAIPVTFKNMDNAMKAAEDQSYITHKGIEAAECCKLLTFICLKFINEKKKDNIKRSLEELLNDKSEIYNYLKLDSVKGLAMSQKDIINPKSKKPENWDWKADVFAYNNSRVDNPYQGGTYIGSYAMDCMAMALHILYHTTSFQQAIDVASKLCGDADTVAAVVGQMAGAFYGFTTFPPEWMDNLYKYDHGEIAIRTLILFVLADKIIYQ
jgi:ADP-ribosylglycohydrolase